MRQLPVLAPSIDRILWKVTEREAASLVRRGQAVRLDRALRLTEQTGDDTECRTRISWGGPRAAMGLSQDYTTRNQKGCVDGFKRLFIEDQPIFNAAWLGTVDL
jgi:hypothetical protein